MTEEPTGEVEDHDIAKDTLLRTLSQLHDRISARGVEGVSIVKRICEGPQCDAEHWVLEISIPGKAGKTPSTFVSAEAPSKPS